MTKRIITNWLIVVPFVVCLTTQVNAEEGQDAAALAESIKLPGIAIDFEKRHVDVVAEVCLDQGLLELVACTKGTKEHESVVAIAAEPVHVHTALLLIGARNGNPAMRKPINEEQTRWMHVPPRGDPIEVLLVVTDADGKQTERPISDFISRSEGDPYMPYQEEETSAEQAEDEKKEKFPTVFVFAGSHLIEDEEHPPQYLAAQSGNIISISTFGDELLCLPEIQSHANAELSWEVDSTHLPEVGSKVTLRLRPKVNSQPE